MNMVYMCLHVSVLPKWMDDDEYTLSELLTLVLLVLLLDDVAHGKLLICIYGTYVEFSLS